MEKSKIAVIGGGIQGLALAYFLSKRGNYSVTVLERSEKLGGLLGILEINGTPCEGFYHQWFKKDADIIGLAKELGLGNSVYYNKSASGIFYGGRVYPFSSARDLLRFSPLPIWDRLRLGAVLAYLKWKKDYRPLEKFRAADWLKKYCGPRAYTIVWEPLLQGKFGDRKDEISMAWMWGRLHARANTQRNGGEQFAYPRGGFKKIIDALADRIKQSGGAIRLGAPIESLEKYGTGVAVTAGGRRTIFEKVFVTTPVSVFSKITKSLSPDYLERLSGIRYRAAQVAVLVLKKSLLPQGYYWLNVNDRSLPLLAVIEHTNFVPKEDYGGDSVVYLGNYPDPADPIFLLGEKPLLDLYCAGLAKINPEFRPDWIKEYYLFRDRAAQPVVDTGYRDKIPPYETPIPNLYLVTMAQIYPEDRGTSNAVRQAKTVLQKLGL